MTLSILISIIGLIVAAVICLLLSLSRDHYLVGAFKMVASTGYLVLCIAAGGLHSAYGLAVFIGLIFSWWGDLFLISKTRSIFLLGLLSFLATHAAYTTAFIMQHPGKSAPVAALSIMLVPGIFVGRWLYPYLKEMRVPVLLYMIAITVMVAFAAGVFLTRGYVITLAGAGLFYVSDLFVARYHFIAPGKINQVIGLPLYYAGQILLSLSVIYVYT